MIVKEGLKPTSLIYKYITLFASRYTHAWQQLLCQFPARQLTAILSPAGSSTAGESNVMPSFLKLFLSLPHPLTHQLTRQDS